jgi:hypothetical protein
MTKQEALQKAQEYASKAAASGMPEKRQANATLSLAYATMALSLPENVATARPFTDATQR